MAIWTFVTTILFTLVIGIPLIVIAIFSPTGKVPYMMGKCWAWLILKTNRVKPVVFGLEKIIRSKSYVFVSNHLSHLDPPAIAVKLPNVLRFVGKRSLFKIPVFGWAAKLAKMISIDRNNSEKAIQSINRTIQDLKNGISAYFFAEGTRSDNGRLKPFKKGGIILAIRSRLPIVPVTIIGSDRLLPKGTLRIKRGVMKIIVGDPIDTSGYSEETRDQLLERVREVIRQTLVLHGAAG